MERKKTVDNPLISRMVIEAGDEPRTIIDISLNDQVGYKVVLCDGVILIPKGDAIEVTIRQIKRASSHDIHDAMWRA